MIHVVPIKISAAIKPGDDLGAIIIEAVAANGEQFLDGDILLVAQKIVSKSEGRVIDLRRIRPSKKANILAREHGKDPRLAELILRESTNILKARSGIIVSETKHGFVCANAGVDQSNTEDGESAVLLPLDPDLSASRLRKTLTKKTRAKVAVLITDTFGRPFRIGQTNVAIGVAGIKPIRSYIGEQDMYGRKLRVTEIAVADELASAAELAMGKSERVPVVIVRGYEFENSESASIKQLIRSKENDLFR